MQSDILMEKLEKVYGKGKGAKVYTTVMPGILADFERMLSSAGDGEEISEEYCLEDGKGIIVVRGIRRADGTIMMKTDMR